MTTSGITTGQMTAQEMIQAALEELGALSAGETAEGSELTVGLRALNWMLKTFSARGVNLWREETRDITIPANTATITLDDDIEDVLDARVQQSGYERQILRYNRGQYLQLPNKASPGSPTAFYVDRQRDAVKIAVWPVPRADTVLRADILRRIEDVTDPTQTVDVPAKWNEAVYMNLAARMASVMGTVRIDPQTANSVAVRAQAFEQLLLDDDRPQSIFMGAYGGRDF